MDQMETELANKEQAIELLADALEDVESKIGSQKYPYSYGRLTRAIERALLLLED